MNEPWGEHALDVYLMSHGMWLQLLRWVAHRSMAHAIAAAAHGQQAWHPVDAILFWAANWPWGYSSEQRAMFWGSYLDRHAMLKREGRPEAAPTRASGGVHTRKKRRKKHGR